MQTPIEQSPMHTPSKKRKARPNARATRSRHAFTLARRPQFSAEEWDTVLNKVLSPSDHQKLFLQKFKIPDEMIDSLDSKAEAHVIITRLVEKSKEQKAVAGQRQGRR